MHARKQGFSLTEVLVSLVLISICSCLLFEVQHQAFHWQKKLKIIQADKQQGFGLPELMLGLAVSSLLMLILMQMLLSTGMLYEKLHTKAQETLDLQWGYELMAHRVAHAGFTPCRRIDKLNPALKPIEITQDKPQKLIVHAMDEEAFTRIHILNKNTVLAKGLHLKPKYPVLIADCHHAEINHIATINPNHEVILERGLSYDYEEEVYMGEWLSDTFYMKNHPKKGPGLYYKRHRADFLFPMQQLVFKLKKSGLIIQVVMQSGAKHHLHAEPKVP